jgi:hypothetical protein
VTATVPLAVGVNTLTATATNAFGTADASITVTRGAAPVIAITAPADGLLTNQTPIEVTGTLAGSSPVDVTVNGVAATVTGGTWTATVPLVEGANSLTATATNAFGGASDARSVTLDTAPPLVTITAPADGVATSDESVTVSGTVTDASPIASFTLNGAAVPLVGGTFTTTVALAAGANPITAVAVDAAGNQGDDAASITHGFAPGVAITAPADGTLTALSAIAVSGTVTGTTPVTIDVNGVATSVIGGTWTASVPLVEGANSLTAAATNAFGSASDAISVTLDATPPVVTITTPAEGAQTAAGSVVVEGTVVDASAITALLVNGLPVSVVGGSFTTTVSLAVGANPIAAVATDAAGNTGSDSVDVTRGIPPTIAIATPGQGFATTQAEALVTGAVTGTEPLIVVVNGLAASVAAGAFSATIPLSLGANAITASVSNAFGNANAEVSGTRTETGPPLSITIQSPPSGSVVSARVIPVSGTVSDGTAQVTVNGAAAIVTGTQYIAPVVELVEGENTLVAVATRGSETAQSQTAVTYNAPPRVVITSPADGDQLRVAATEVEGVVDDLAAFVDVNGVVASVGPGGRFTASDVPLALGENPLRARAIDPFGAMGTDEVRVTRDDASLPPLRLVFVSLRRYPFVVESETEPSPLIAEDPAAFRAALDSLGFPGDEFEPPIERIQYSHGGHVAFVFAEEPGDVDFFENDVFLDGPLPLQPIEALPNDFLFQFGDLDPALIPALLPVDFEARYYATFDRSIIIEGGEPPQGDSTLRAVATHGGVDELLASAETGLPFVAIHSPAAGSTVASGSVTLTGTAVSDGNLFQRVRYVVQDTENYIQIATGSAPLVAGRFTIPDVPLGTGRHCATVTAIDAAGNSEGASTCITVDADAPAVSLVSPRDGEAVLASSVAVDLNFAAPMTLVSVNGTPDGRSFPAGLASGALLLALAPGANVVTLVVDSGAGPVTLSFTLFRVASIEPIRILEPADGALLNTTSTLVSVRAPLGTSAVTINGTVATRAADGVSFTADVAVRSGDNPVAAIAYPFGQTATANLVGDFRAPRLLASIPEDRVTTANDEIFLAGFFDEAARVSVESPAGTVSASTRFDLARSNQLFGSEVHRFDVAALPLLAGSNPITVRARDAAGNETAYALTVERRSGALQLVSPAAGSSVADLVTSVTLRASETVTVDAWVVAGRQVPALASIAIAAGVDTIVSGIRSPRRERPAHRPPPRGRHERSAELQLTSTEADCATVAGQVTDAHQRCDRARSSRSPRVASASTSSRMPTATISRRWCRDPSQWRPPPRATRLQRIRARHRRRDVRRRRGPRVDRPPRGGERSAHPRPARGSRHGLRDADGRRYRAEPAVQRHRERHRGAGRGQPLHGEARAARDGREHDRGQCFGAGAPRRHEERRRGALEYAGAPGEAVLAAGWRARPRRRARSARVAAHPRDPWERIAIRARLPST